MGSATITATITVDGNSVAQELSESGMIGLAVPKNPAPPCRACGRSRRGRLAPPLLTPFRGESTVASAVSSSHPSSAYRGFQRPRGFLRFGFNPAPC